MITPISVKLFPPSIIVNRNPNLQSHAPPSTSSSNQMAAKPLTPAAIAMTEKKMDMSLDDIIKMSKNGTAAGKGKKQRIPNKNQKFSNNVVQEKSMRLRRFMDSRSSLRQGVLAQRRSNFQGNQFPLAAEAARKAAVAPVHNRNFNRNQAVTSYKPRGVARPVKNNGDYAVKKQQVKVVSSTQKPQTLDSLFANMKEQRMKVLSQQQQQQKQNNGGRRNGAGQQRPRPPWTRYNN
ncbi:hypothetical protein QVD17_28319 [Tagetes erecta]|uniref:Uncharacterized protein n=1 Tax=Tagetes erecta TaxID=13708 RepID=A0AAD8NKD0_TARER|nr:hypothetical protein QVD17_28319 [Tagetes erecta]